MIRCALYFGYKLGDNLDNPDPSRVIDFTSSQTTYTNPRGNFKWGRTYNTNALYIKEAAADPSQEGGFGFDLGFSEDNFTLSFTTFNYDEAFRIIDIIKTYSLSTSSGIIKIYNRQYPFLVRTCNQQALAGSSQVNMTLTITIVGDF